MNAAPVETISDVWGCAPISDLSSRQLPLSTFSTVRVEAQDYWEYHRILDSIEARLQILKRDAGLASEDKL